MLHRGNSTAEPALRRSARNSGLLPHLQRFIVGKAGPERSCSRSRRRPTRLASGARAAPHGAAAAAAESSERPSSCSRAVVVDLVSPACNSPLARRASARCKSTARDRASRVAAAEEAARSATAANQAADAVVLAAGSSRKSHSRGKTEQPKWEKWGNTWWWQDTRQATWRWRLLAEFNKRQWDSDMKRKAAEAAETAPEQWAAAAAKMQSRTKLHIARSSEAAAMKARGHGVPRAAPPLQQVASVQDNRRAELSRRDAIVAIDEELDQLEGKRSDLAVERQALVARTEKLDQEVAYLEERAAELTLKREDLEMEMDLADQSDVRELEEDGARQVVSGGLDGSCGGSSLRSAEADRMRAMEQQMTAIAAQMSTLVAALGKPQCTSAGAATSLPALGAQGAGQDSEDNNQRRNPAACRRLGSRDPGR